MVPSRMRCFVALRQRRRFFAALGTMARAIHALLFSSVFAASPPLTATVLPPSYVSKFGAACLDGTAPAIYTHLGADASTWGVFLEGGGWCFDVTPEATVKSCFGRAAGGLGSSNGITTNKSTTNIGGILSTDVRFQPAAPPRPPFARRCSHPGGAPPAATPRSPP